MNDVNNYYIKFFFHFSIFLNVANVAKEECLSRKYVMNVAKEE